MISRIQRLCRPVVSERASSSGEEGALTVVGSGDGNESVERVCSTRNLVVRENVDDIAHDGDHEAALTDIDWNLRRNPSEESISREQLTSGLGDRRRSEEEL